MDDRSSPRSADPSAQPVALYEERGVADVLNAAFAFFRAFAVPLIKGLVYFAGPVLVTGQILATYGVAGASQNPAAVAGLSILGSLANAFGSMVATTVVLAAILLYRDEGKEGVTVAAIWEQTKTWFGAILGTGLVVGIGIGLAAGILAIVVVAVVAAAGAGGAGPVVVGVGLGMLAVAVFVYLLTKAAVTFPARVFDGRGAVPSIRRSFALVSGHFGSTLAVTLLASLIAGLLSLVFNLPALLVRMGTALGIGGTAVASILSGTVAGLGSVVLSAVPTLASTFQYFSLVEAHENAGLAARVDALEEEAGNGDPPAGAPPAGAPPAGDPPAGDPPAGEPSEDEPSEDEPSEDEPSEDEPSAHKSSEGRAGGPSAEAAPDRTAEGGSSRSDASPGA